MVPLNRTGSFKKKKCRYKAFERIMVFSMYKIKILKISVNISYKKFILIEKGSKCVILYIKFFI